MSYQRVVFQWLNGINLRLSPNILLKDWACYLNHLYLTGAIKQQDLYTFRVPFYVQNGNVVIVRPSV